MGIKKLFDVSIDNYTTVRDLKETFNISDKSICVDSSSFIYKYFYASFDEDGNNENNFSNYKKLIYNCVNYFVKNNVTSIWIFDGQKNEYKAETHIERKRLMDNKILKDIKKREPELSEISDITDLNINSVEMNLTFSYNDKDYIFLKPYPGPQHTEYLTSILTEHNIKYHVACHEEAEHLAVKICKRNNYNGVLSSDTDVLLFGGNLIISESLYEYHIYYIEKVLSSLKVTYEELCKICLMLGCDFCDKTYKVGPKKVLKQFRDIKLTERQTLILNYVLDSSVADRVENNEETSVDNLTTDISAISIDNRENESNVIEDLD